MGSTPTPQLESVISSSYSLSTPKPSLTKTTPSTSVIWVNAEEALQLGIPVPVRKLIQQHLLA